MVPYFQPGTAYASAVAQDDELIEAERAGQSLDGNPTTYRFRPQSLGWTYGRSDTADIKDMLKTLLAMTARSDRTPEPTPRPYVASERWEESRRKENTNWLNEQLGITT